MKKGGSQGRTGKPKAAKPQAGKPKEEKPTEKRDENAALRKELQGLLADIDAEGLRFLVDQARILKYNAEVDRMNRELEVKRIRLRSELSAGKSSPKTAAPPSAVVMIEEGKSRSHFIITLGNSRKFFVRDEFRALVKVCDAAEDAAAGAGRLFVWLKRNRADVLADVGIGSGSNPLLQELYRKIRKSYRAKT